MPRVRHLWSHSRTAPLVIWLISAAIFYCLFQMVLHYPALPAPNSSGSSVSNEEKRNKLYDKLSRDLNENGAAFLKHGETSQSLSLSEIFIIKDGAVTPVPKAANPAVRANILYLSPQYSVPIAEAVKSILLPYFDKGFIPIKILSYNLNVLSPRFDLNSSLYHFSMFHTSHHISPVPATKLEIEEEIKAVKAVADGLCPLSIHLDRVVLTSTGVLLGCWQVNSGTDPEIIRNKLKAALPRAPEKQLYDAVMLHTSFARLLGYPTKMPEGKNTTELQFFQELVTRLNSELYGFQATVSELWYVEEYDILALALNGRMKVHKFQLRCSKP